MQLTQQWFRRQPCCCFWCQLRVCGALFEVIRASHLSCSS